ncbi:MAG: hypothetical protein KDA90_21585 [Planctomycetaceae bacterium]|nr:hypothetical protein [Planctomycetaceae bacterium]
MSVPSRIHRCLIVAALIFSVGFAQCTAAPVVTAAVGTIAQASQPAKKCCCGTADGKCCGMGCCVARQAPGPEQTPLRNERDSRDGQRIPPAICCFGMPLDVNAGAGQQSGNSRFNASRLREGGTLQAQGVRLNV